ncbi:hypothetical protein LSH36_135g04013 [Paralvinella palmiformis]|uniref:Uncharacterized protein n=1 Tax=Paralvinella palmiformis TaxID=53620 RepID=A0AAD9N7U6_9ANNE|nr:hypothetical protein LSH36_135g04013 [Paralvinella palmiformis]
MEIRNNAGQTALEVADPDLKKFLMELKLRQASLKKDREERIQDVAQRGGVPPLRRRSSVTRMSVDQKQSVVRSNVEEERAIMRNKVFEEERKSSESSETEDTPSSSTAESSSDSETEKKNEINRNQRALGLNIHTNNQVNGTAPMPTTAPATTLTEKEKAPKPEPPTPIIEEAEESKPPPPKPVPPSTVTPTPRIQDLAETKRLQKEADKENERLVEYNFSNRLSRTDKIQKDIKQKDELKNDENLLKDERKKEDRLGETEVPGFAPKPPTHGVNANGEGPAAWRAGLRKMGSSSAVPECATNKYKDIDKLLRSASSSWLSNTDKKQDNIRGRTINSTLPGDPLETRNRYEGTTSGVGGLVSGSSLVSRSALPSARITSGANNTSTSASLSHVISQPSSVSTSSSSLTCSTRTSAAPSVSAAVPASTMTTSSTSLSSSYTYQPFVPLSRRKPSEDDATGLVSPTARSVANTSTGSVARRSFVPPTRDEEREAERKARARRARESRRSTQGVTRADLERAEQELKAAGEERSGTSRTSSMSSTGSTDDKSDKENKPEETSTTTTTSSYLRRQHQPDDKTSSVTDKDSPSQKSAAIRSKRKRESRKLTGKVLLEDIQQATKTNDEIDSVEKPRETWKVSVCIIYITSINGINLKLSALAKEIFLLLVLDDDTM